MNGHFPSDLLINYRLECCKFCHFRWKDRHRNNWRILLCLYTKQVNCGSCEYRWRTRQYLQNTKRQNVLQRENRRRRKTMHFFHLPFTLKISNNTKLTSAGVSIAWISCFTGAYVQSHSITAHRIDVTAVRIGRALVDIWEEEWEKLLIGLQRTLYQY